MLHFHVVGDPPVARTEIEFVSLSHTQESLVAPIYKGDRYSCENYRKIRLVNTAFKLPMDIVLHQLSSTR